ncbi:MAG: UDP-2,3-diacylglucosamine diphosphatase, partial [Rhodospirillales bacterium]|nr:UDP-2,3-diacylglucosamine diphosphatase [Rhodospirillales bacterium]
MSPANMKKHYRTVFLSDLHLGFHGSQAREIARLLKRIRCEKLYLVGDIVDMWRLKQRWYWPAEHNDVVRRILKLAKKG